MLMSAGRVEIKSNVFAFLIELKAGRARQTLWKGGLTGELVRKLPRRKHRFGVDASCLRKSIIERERRCVGLRSRLIRQVKQYLFGGGIVVAEWNVSSGGRGWFQACLLRGFLARVVSA